MPPTVLSAITPWAPVGTTAVIVVRRSSKYS